MENITDQLVKFMEQKKKDFMSLSALNKALPMPLRKQLGLKASDKTPQIKKCIEPYVGDVLVIQQMKRKSLNLAFKRLFHNITEQLVKLLEQKKVDFMSLSVLNKALPALLREQLGLKASDKTPQIKKCLVPHLGAKFTILQGRTPFIAFKQPEEVLLFRVFQNQPGKTPGMLAKNLPFKKADFLGLLNKLLEQGAVRVQLNDKYVPRIYPVENVDLALHTPSLAVIGENFTEAMFRSAFQELDQGKFFVCICDIRRKLNWPTGKFNLMLRTLRDAGTIQLHAADTHALDKRDIDDSYVDENGFLMGTLSWRRHE